MTQPGHLEGKILCMIAMNHDPGRDVVSDGSSRGGAAVDELYLDGLGVGKGWQVMLAQERWIQEGIGRTRVDQRLDGNRRLAGHEDVDQQSEMARDGERKGGRKRRSASQPGPYWLGCPFFGREEVSKGVGGDGGKKGGGPASRDPGKAPGREKLLGETRLEGTRLEGTRMAGNRPGTEQQQQQQQRWQQLQQ